MRVLAVDDSKDILDLIKDILTNHGFEVDTADNGAAALDKYVRLKPDIVTLDVAMPVMDGYETLKRLLVFDKNANVIMLTANEQHKMLENCLEKGAIGYIPKPFTAKELVSLIDIAWKAGADKKVATLFSLACNKIQYLLMKLRPGSDVSVTINQFAVIRQQAVTHILSSPYHDLAQVRVIPSLADDLHIEVPPNTTGFVTEFGGQQAGLVVSFTENKAMLETGGMPRTVAENAVSTDKATEFFSMFNSKIISELANSEDLMLTILPTRTFDHAEYRDISLGKQATKAIFDILIDKKKSSIETQVWFNTSGISRRI